MAWDNSFLLFLFCLLPYILYVWLHVCVSAYFEDLWSFIKLVFNPYFKYFPTKHEFNRCILTLVFAICQQASYQPNGVKVITKYRICQNWFFLWYSWCFISLRLWKTLLPNWEVFVDFEYMTSGCYLNSMVLKDSTKLQSWHNIYSLHSNLYTTCYFPVWLFFKSLCVSLGMVIVTQGDHLHSLTLSLCASVVLFPDTYAYGTVIPCPCPKLLSLSQKTKIL